MDDQNITDHDLGNGAVLRTINIPAIIAERTGTRTEEWEEIDGPESGVGIDYWYHHEANDWTAYVSLDQDDVSISVTGPDGEEILCGE